MDQAIRNKLRNVVTQCRKLLEEAVAQVLQGQFGIYATGKKDEVHVDDDAKMKHLSDEDRAYRKDILDHLEHVKALGYKPKDSLAQLVREISFTHLNRFCAYKMMEARSLIRESVSKGLKSQGFLFYLADHADDEKRANSGQQDVAYRHFLNWLGGTLSEEIGVLFNPHDSANRLYPPQRVLDDVLNLLNDDALADIWTQDETIGWVYQYFTPKELRDRARKESQAPRNSYELAFRNQFFTPRYVVEFLTDNTLGRIWYEMRKGETKLKDQCRYMVRRPSEIFLRVGEQPPKDAAEGRDDLSQEELLKLPVHIPHRPKKDPRELKILDPACGSGHFLLYCFDLLLTIYEEAYSDPELGQKIQQDYPTLDALKRDVPRLILANNLHGIDIDLRASQIAALALWLRCQRTYQDVGLKKDRPKITRSNFVCAEPMPGEPAMLKEFVSQLEPRLLGQLVEVVFDKMKLAGEAGSLLKIEEEIRTAVASAKRQWESGPVEVQRTLFDRFEPKPKQKRFNLSGITDEEFFNEAEAKVVEALRSYAEKATNGQRLQRRLFTEDAVRGFAFVDLCHKRFDVVLMNPPFGESSKQSKAIVEKQYPRTKNDLFAAFVEQGINRLNDDGMLGAITSRTGFFLSSFQKWREEVLLVNADPSLFADLGYGVLDSAMVETALYCIRKRTTRNTTPFIRLLQADDKDASLLSSIASINTGKPASEVFHVTSSSFATIPGSPFAYWVSARIRKLFLDLPPFDNESEGRSTRCGLGTTDNFRFLRLNWEVPVAQRNTNWLPYYDGGVYSPIYDLFPLVVWWQDNGREIKEFVASKFGSESRNVRGEDFYQQPGFIFPRRTKGLCPKVMAAGGVFSNAGQAGFVPKAELLASIGFLTSEICSLLISLSQGRTGDAAQFEVGLIKRMPWVELHDKVMATRLSSRTRAICDAKRRSCQGNEVAPDFIAPHALIAKGDSLRDQIHNAQSTLNSLSNQVAERLDEINSIVLEAYNIAQEDRLALAACANKAVDADLENESDEESEEATISATPDRFVKEIISYAIGCTVGRFDVRFATGHQKVPELSDPLDPLPVFSPGCLRSVPGISVVTAPEEYPLLIDDDGILVDSPDSVGDILRRTREVLEVVWKERADEIEKDACEILGVKELRDYFRKPGKGGFWDDHVSRYSKSRRKAPIYWLLQSSKKNFGLWLYYHRLDKDLLFKALVNYVEPKIRLEVNRLDSLRSQKAAAGDTGKTAKKIDKDIEQQEDLISELQDFEDKLRRAANLHLEPDLNDGVVLNIAPLHELVPWKEAKSYWNELLEGKYEWSSIGKQLREKGLVQ